MENNLKCHPVADFINQSLANSCLCEIGKGVLRDAVMNSCGHSYCRACLEDYLKQSTACPACQKPIDKPKMLPSQNLNQIVNFLEIKCKNHESGCGWNKSIMKLDKHLKDCEFEKIECEFCNAEQMRKDLDAHLKKCPMRVTNCLMCLKQMNIEELEKHGDLCPEKVIGCSGGCSEKVKRKHMGFHVEHVCALVTIDCPFKEFGCEFHGLVEDVVGHTEDKRVGLYHKRLEIASRIQHQGKMGQQVESLLKELKNTVSKLSPKVPEQKISKKPTALFIPLEKEKKTTSKKIPYSKPIANTGVSFKTQAKTNDLSKKQIQHGSMFPPKDNFANMKALHFGPNNKKNSTGLFKNQSNNNNYNRLPANKCNNFMNVIPFNPQTNLFSKMRFSTQFKGPSLNVSTNGRVINHSQNSSELGLINQMVVPNQTYVFKINRMSSMIGIGIGNLSTLKNNKFCFLHNRKDHGCFMWLFDGNYVMDNQAGSYALPNVKYFNQGDVIRMTLEPRGPGNVLVFRKAGLRQNVEITVNSSPFDNMYPIVYLQNGSCEVALV